MWGKWYIITFVFLIGTKCISTHFIQEGNF